MILGLFSFAARNGSIAIRIKNILQNSCSKIMPHLQAARILPIHHCKNLTCTGKNLIYFLPCKNHARLCSKIRQESCMLTRFLQDLGKILERSCIKSWQDLGKIFDRVGPNLPCKIWSMLQNLVYLLTIGLPIILWTESFQTSYIVQH